jgi:hypothetical protein
MRFQEGWAVSMVPYPGRGVEPWEGARMICRSSVVVGDCETKRSM